MVFGFSLLTLLYRIIPQQNSVTIVFTCSNPLPAPRHASLITDAQSASLYAFIRKYWAEPTAKRRIWPRDLRELYNNCQAEEGLQIMLPRVFLTSLTLPQDFCE